MSTRRTFLKAAAFPAIVPASVFGQNAPSNRIQVGQIGCGRIARASEFPGILRHATLARFTAVCDVDSVRAADAKQMLEDVYGAGAAVKTYADYREMLADKSIDAVCISTPDHWHAQPAIEAALAGKAIYLQKPASLTVVEGRQMADVVKRTGAVLQLGSQQRSASAFRYACELVRNGRIGAVREIYIGLPVDPSGEVEPAMPVPKNLDYARWLGSTPLVPYTEKRVHPQSPDPKLRYERPGWLRCEQFGAGMITGWGTHHIDIAHWAMDLEHSGPVEIEALARFPERGLWDVHGPFHIRMRYPNGAVMYLSDRYPNGVKFVGEEGWVWVTRGDWPAEGTRVLNASNKSLLRGAIGDRDLRLHASPQDDHHLDWLASIRAKRQPVAPAEAGHRSCTACLVAHAAMRLGRRLEWTPEHERFVNSDAANAMLARPQRAPYGTEAALRSARL